MARVATGGWKMIAKKIHPINPRFMRYAEKNIEAVYKE